MPWQRHVADVAMEVDPTTGRLAYREVRLTVPRQSGKSTLLCAVMTHRCLMEARQRVVYTAQTRNDARLKWDEDHADLVERSPLRARLRQVRRANGSEAIIWRNGSRWGIQATTEKAGHGHPLDLATIDEAFAQVDDRLEQSFKPAMITRPQPQLWIVSTAGTEESVYLNSKIDHGRGLVADGVTSGVAYFEWSAHEDLDPSDPATWWSCMPALGHTITPDAIAADFASMKLPEFRRAYLNQRVDSRVGDPVIPLESWDACRDDLSRPLDPVCFALDVAPDRGWGSIGLAAARQDGRLHLEVVDRRQGTEWMVDRVAELRARWRPAAVALDPAGPAGSLLPRLQANGLEVSEVSMRQHAQACMELLDAVVGRRVAHLAQPSLDGAVSGARKRLVGDSWLWTRAGSSVDISPLVAVTLALRAHLDAAGRASRPGFMSLADL